MPVIGVRELKTRTAEILKDVRERQTHYVITYRGKPIGVLGPVVEAPQKAAPGTDPWEQFVQISKEIGETWESPLTANEILLEMRR